MVLVSEDDGDGVGLSVGVTLAVKDGVLEEVGEVLGVTVVLGLAEKLPEGVGVHVAVCVWLGLEVGDAVQLPVALPVGDGVLVGVRLLVVVCVGVGVCDGL